jgi:hypothetical protein
MIGFNNLIRPYYAPKISIETIDDVSILVIWVPGGDQRPYEVPEDVKAKEKRYYYYILSEQIQALQTQAIAVYTPEVEYLIQSKCKDCNQIEHLLDGLLDFAGNDKILALYRKLCRYYYFINPEATTDYIRYYREAYDEDGELFKSGYFKNTPIK